MLFLWFSLILHFLIFFCSSISSTRFFYFHVFFLLLLFEHFFFNFTHYRFFFGFLVIQWILLFWGEFLAVFMLFGCYFLLINIFRRLPSLYISTPYTSRYTKSGQAHFPKMQLLTKSSTDIVVLKILAFAL